MGRAKGKEREQRRKKEAARQKAMAAKRAAEQVPPPPPAEPDGPPPAAVDIAKKKNRFALDRVSLWFVFFFLVAVAAIGYVLPLIAWIISVIAGKENPRLDTYMNGAGAAVGFISVCLGIASLIKSHQSDRQAEETACLLREVQGVVTSLKGEIGAANAVLREMHTSRDAAPPAVQAAVPWRRDTAQNVEPLG